MERKAINWQIFRASSLVRNIRLEGSAGGDRIVLVKRGVDTGARKRLFSMDDEDVRDLIDTLQKCLAVREENHALHCGD